MKGKTRLKLAARGMGPLVRPGTPGRGRRGALAPDPRGAAAAATVVEMHPVVEDEGPLGEIVEPSGGWLRQRVRLRPVVREALDVEARRLGMTREALCRVVLEEVARRAAEGPLAGPVGVVGTAEEVDSGSVGAEDVAEIPAGYAVPDSRAGSPASLGSPDSPDAAAGAAPDSVPRVASVSPPARAAAPRPLRAPTALRFLRAFRRWWWTGARPRVPARRLVAAGLVLVALVGVVGAVVSWRYQVVGAGADAFYVVDRWRGALWRCGAGASGSPACAPAVVRRPVAGREVVSLGTVAW